MDIVSKSEKDLIKILPVAVPMILIAILTLVFTSRCTSNSAITPFKDILLNPNAIIMLCDKVILKNDLIQLAFENFSYTKVSGSSPVKFYSLSGSSGNDISKFSIGQDSKNHNFFWLYPEQTSTYYRGKNIGYIESKYIKENTDKCE